ncbi:putative iron uptake protein [Pseudomonas sp. BAY1663]|uniref:Iron transporter n=1 Tax=Stutzerimonas stutzeri TaxID=316 RepID=A0A2N8T2D7_STUST|nr:MULTISPECIES: hypothetical protein [Pseudomonadaceae]EXF42956.1 putative iron uptake protein [Pseudomonas sp. BAY1663]MCQ4324232.1 iron transporter [Stutzerimonas stutzeri]PNG08866.1 iron transporter [Stutzerimonas stutzeri]
MTRLAPPDRSRTPEIAARTALAIFGGYAFSYGFTAALARLLPMARVDAAVVATLLSFVIYLLFILWAFSARSLRRVLIGVLSALPLAAIGFWPQLLEKLG